jgi:hypothetical protein
MTPIRLRIDRIVDFGTIVSLVGCDSETGEPVTVHVDHRPFKAFWDAWQQEGFPQPVEYDAERLILRLDVMPNAADA